MKYDKKKAGEWSLFIGRYQPFHLAHKELMETVLRKGGKVCIGLRDTPISEKNPFTIKQRRGRIKRMMAEWGDRVKIVVLPDIGEVCYGRDVGWNVRRIYLPKRFEMISATKIRNQVKR